MNKEVQIKVGDKAILSKTFTQEDVNNSRVTYHHNGAHTSPDAFTFTVADGGEDSVQPASGSFSITVAN